MSRETDTPTLAVRSTARAGQAGREKRVSSHLPFTHFIDLDIIGTRDGDMMMTIHLKGAPSETVDDVTTTQRF